MDQTKRMKELVQRLNQASKAYYQEDREIMSNLEYDRLYDELLEHGRAAKDLAFGTPLHWEDVDGVEPH